MQTSGMPHAMLHLSIRVTVSRMSEVTSSWRMVHCLLVDCIDVHSHTLST